MKTMICLTMLALLTACSDKKPKPETAAPGAQPAGMPTFNAPAGVMPSQEDPAKVLAEVNGIKFTAGEADQEVALRLAGAGGNIPPEVIPRLRQSTVDQFITRAVLLSEADRKKITVSPEEETEMMEKLAVQLQLPPGTSIEDFMRNSPLGEEKMREQITIGIRINKLMETVLDKDTPVTETEIEAFIKENQDNLAIPETVHARHILVTVDEADDAETKAEKQKKAESIRKKLTDGADFAEIALADSDCPSKDAGGDLGTFPRDRMVKEFADAAFAQKVNDIGPVVKTQYGYHVIQVLEHKEAGNVPKEQITEFLKSQKMQQAFMEYVEELRAKADIKNFTL